MLKEDNNRWIDNPDSIKALVQNYFQNLLRDQNTNPGVRQVVHPHVSLTREDNMMLCSPISPAEIWNCVKNIDPFKAPGPDGIEAIFYQKYWNLVGKHVCDFVQNCFDSSSIPEEVNKTLISLIPKKGKPRFYQNIQTDQFMQCVL